MKSIFNLPQRVEDLESTNDGAINYRYMQVNTIQDIADSGATSNFSGKEIRFKWSLANHQWWLPNRAYLRVRVQLDADGAGTALQRTNGAGPNMNMCASLFQKCSFLMGSHLIESIDNDLPQIDTLWKRLNKSGDWLSGTDAQLNFMQPDVYERINHVTLDGHVKAKNYNAMSRNYFLQPADADSGVLPTFLDLVTPNQITFAANASPAQNITFTANGGDDIPDFTTSGDLSVGDYIFYNDGAEKRGQIEALFADGLSVEGTPTAVGAADLVNQFRVGYYANEVADKGRGSNEARNIKDIECCFSIPLSLFRDWNKAIPGGSDCELVFNASDNYRIQAVESPSGATQGTDYYFQVKDMKLMLPIMDAQRIPRDFVYLLDLKPIRLHKKSISSQDTQYAFDINPSCVAITVAFQDNRVATDTLYSVTKFKGGANEELSLQQFYVIYAGQQKPEPAYEVEYDTTNRKDYIVEIYNRNLHHSKMYFRDSAESLKEWRDRGIYILTLFPKDASDRSTRVIVKCKFSNGNITANTNLLVFEHYRSAVFCTMQDDKLVEVKHAMS